MLGGVYALISSGLNIIYGVMRTINFVQSEFVMLGLYITCWFITASARFVVAVQVPESYSC